MGDDGTQKRLSPRQSMEAIRRNLWTRKETNALLKIFKERNVVNLLMRKTNSPVKIFSMVESQMRGCGFTQKSTLQIMRKWKKLKSAYCVRYRPKDSFIDESKIPYFKEIHEIMTGRLWPGEMQPTDKDPDDINDLFMLNGTDPDSLPATLSAAQLKCRDDERRNLWNTDETIAMLEIFRDFNVVRSLKSMRKGNMEVYGMVAKKMAERQFTKKNSNQIRIKWKRLKSCYNKFKDGKSQDVIRSDEVMSLLQSICDSKAVIDDEQQLATNDSEVFQPQFKFETVAILNNAAVNLIPVADTSTTHHIIAAHSDFDQSHIFTSAASTPPQTDKLRAAIPTGIIDANEVTIETSSFESNTDMYDDSQAFGRLQESLQATPEPNVNYQPEYSRATPTFAGPASTASPPFAAKELQDEYFRQERQLLAFKYEMKAEMQKKTFDHMLDGTRRFINDIKADLFNGIRELIDYSKKS